MKALTVIMAAAFLLPTLSHAQKPSPNKRNIMQGAAKMAHGIYRRGVTSAQSTWRGLQHRRQVNRGFKEVVKQNPEQLKPILAEGRAKTRTARNIKRGAAITTVVSTAASFVAPALIPVAIASGAATYLANRSERRGIQQSRVKVMKNAMLSGQQIPSTTDAHYRPLVLKSIQADITSAQKTVKKGEGKMKRLRPGVVRAQKRAKAAVKRYRKRKAPFVQTREQVRGATSQMRELGQQLEQLGTPPQAD